MELESSVTSTLPVSHVHFHLGEGGPARMALIRTLAEVSLVMGAARSRS